MNCHCNKPSLVITDLSNYDKIYKCDECICDFRKVVSTPEGVRRFSVSTPEGVRRFSVSTPEGVKPKGPLIRKKLFIHQRASKTRKPFEELKTNILLFESNPLLTKFQEIEFQLQSQGIPIFNHKKETMIEFIQRIKKIF